MELTFLNVPGRKVRVGAALEEKRPWKMGKQKF
jgi:hypothetical protein